jgi:hypothetical protein
MICYRAGFIERTIALCFRKSGNIFILKYSMLLHEDARSSYLSKSGKGHDYLIFRSFDESTILAA